MGYVRPEEVMKLATPGTFDVVLGHDGTHCGKGTHWDVWLPKRGPRHLPENNKHKLGPHLEAADWHFLTEHFSERLEGFTAEQLASSEDLSKEGPEGERMDSSGEEQSIQNVSERLEGFTDEQLASGEHLSVDDGGDDDHGLDDCGGDDHDLSPPPSEITVPAGLQLSVSSAPGNVFHHHCPFSIFLGR